MLSLAVVLFLTHSGTTQTVIPTYAHVDAVMSVTLTCSLCPPGTYMHAFCTATKDTVCLSCPTNHFTQFWNYLPKCLYCTNICNRNQIVKEQCSPTRNIVCECKEGYYRLHDFCVKHTQCPSGFGAKQIGTVHRNTECERCPRGTFSAVVSSCARCVNHTDCGQLPVLLRGKSWHDNVCTACTDLKDGKREALLRDVLQGFFSHAKLKMRKLSRFVQLLNHDGRPDRLQRFTLLLDVKSWIVTAHKHQLAKLPEILRISGLRGAKGKIDRILTQFEKAYRFCKDI
ncbi:tumor necrosis factor receptor superfamily member 11B-like isoform X1 [Electrophorus electricus]|uniref:tumor necrosis factor receptor superfamily member 11B-like isoform X1 n=1 Tax=Electrophorus electricus TaxID=8005 RepID=UPI0015D09947|nr:tumor necrosis factor receptor superfamily member 11B-like isoform X1 [Electrophorus electricus]